MPHIARTKTPRGQNLIVFSAVSSFALAGIGFGFWIGDRIQSASDDFSIAAEIGSVNLPLTDSATVGDIAAHLGRMQAELLRINALGERLVQHAGLDPQEFDFINAPPRGGPETGRTRDYTIKELADELSTLVVLVQDREYKLDQLADQILDARPRSASTQLSGWPVRSGYITSGYGYRIHPVYNKRQFHSGVDFASPRGAPVQAVADGLVVFSGRRNGYGNVVDIRHRDGLVTRYAHNSTNLVQEGDFVRQGQKIAAVGATGTATGPHVHFEVIRNGQAVNPMPYLRARPTQRLASLDDDSRG
ncbi:Murein DD-endopeptidase MepM and murein hydrolase activator NlpD, contain LysM domain [Allochromatium warmingii]|uniref:Murein DD-endopeptidase MepM and murein hydrolase activator NlpD, contain LysM domain n=1 Tax=Allochromatium warmingii TaxID=61595 RepID=A0A1H3AVR2_ALLWA|nr:M23 family metallopeptidase [Allochromatium warmingii]SDX33822.1 Murein DD-endopeptidase MepM and murein hydrolase activator NlpD, contain LysM domain [Allochromatium warmingii]